MNPDALPAVADLVGADWASRLTGMAGDLLAADVKGLLRVSSEVAFAFRHRDVRALAVNPDVGNTDRKSTRLNSSHRT